MTAPSGARAAPEERQSGARAAPGRRQGGARGAPPPKSTTDAQKVLPILSFSDLRRLLRFLWTSTTICTSCLIMF